MQVVKCWFTLVHQNLFLLLFYSRWSYLPYWLWTLLYVAIRKDCSMLWLVVTTTRIIRVKIAPEVVQLTWLQCKRSIILIWLQCKRNIILTWLECKRNRHNSKKFCGIYFYNSDSITEIFVNIQNRLFFYFTKLIGSVGLFSSKHLMEYV